MIAIGVTCGALGAFGALVIVLELLWQLRGAPPHPRGFPRAWLRHRTGRLRPPK